jgi:hypothetical protein
MPIFYVLKGLTQPLYYHKKYACGMRVRNILFCFWYACSMPVSTSELYFNRILTQNRLKKAASEVFQEAA